MRGDGVWLDRVPTWNAQEDPVVRKVAEDVAPRLRKSHGRFPGNCALTGREFRAGRGWNSEAIMSGVAKRRIVRAASRGPQQHFQYNANMHESLGDQLISNGDPFTAIL